MTTEAEDLEDKYFAATATRQCTPSLLASKFTSSHYQSSEQEEDASLSRTQTTSGTRTSIPSTSHVVPSKRCITPFVPVGLLSKRFGLPMLPSSTQMKEKVKSKDVKPILDPLTLQNLVTSSLLNKAIHLVTSSTSISSFQPPKQMFLKNEDDEHLSSSMSSFPSSSSIVSTLNSPSIQQSAQVQEEGAPLSVTFSPTNTNSNEASSLNPSHLSPTSSSLILKRNTTYSLTDPTTPSLFDSLLSSATTTATTTSSSNSTTNSNSSFSSSSSSSVSTLPPRILFQKKKAQPLTDSPSLPSSTSSSSSSLTTPPMLPISHSTQAALRGRHKKSYVPRSFQFED
ncbi:hypothetical protein HMI55_002538 [Coelomomyces lativittatus]|nr:hypothetical protein HMI55_002538 [Coelomomyces lativittatus]